MLVKFSISNKWLNFFVNSEKFELLFNFMAYLNFADLDAGLIFISLFCGIIGFLSNSLNKIFLSLLGGKYLELFLFSE